MLKQPLIRLAVLGFMLLGSALAFYLISPLFVHATVGYDGWPTLGYMPTRTPRPATETLAPTDTETAAPLMTEFDVSLLESDGASLLASGEFYSVARAGSGRASVYQVTEVGLVLRLEDFVVEDGPDLHLVLTSQENVEETTGFDLANGLDLGRLKALSGDQMYQLPDDLDLTQYRSAVIWSAVDQVAFAAAWLKAP